MEMSVGFFLLFLLFSLGSLGQIRMAKTPNVIPTSPEETVTITCKTLKAVNDANPTLPWNHQKQEQSPPLIIYHAYRQNTGVPDRFSRTVSIPDVILKLANSEIPDEGGLLLHKAHRTPEHTVIRSCTNTFCMCACVLVGMKSVYTS